MQPKAEQLRIFDAVARYRSVSQAAHALGLSQPAVSRQLAQLQEAVGRPLYRRTPSGIELTSFGEALWPHARAVSETLEQARRFVRDGQRQQPLTLRIGLSHHLVTSYTLELLRRAHQARAAGLELSLHMSEGYSAPLIVEVTEHQLDAALVLGDARELPAGLVARQVGEEPLCLLVKPDDPLATQTPLPGSALSGKTFIVPASISWIYRYAQRCLAAAHITPGRIVEVSGPFAVRCAVLEGLGIGVSLRSFIAPELDAGRLQLLQLAANTFTASVQLVMRERAAYTPRAWSALATLIEGRS